MTIPQTYEFEGAQRTFREIVTMVTAKGPMPESTIRNRIAAGDSTISQVRQPKPTKVNTSWNMHKFGKGHMA